MNKLGIFSARSRHGARQGTVRLTSLLTLSAVVSASAPALGGGPADTLRACPTRRTGAGASAPSSACAIRSLGLLHIPKDLENAVRLSLSGWPTAVRTLPAEATRAQALTVTLAQELTERYALQSLVWMTEEPSGSVLRLYSARTGRTSERRVQLPPHPSALTTALALSIKTALRTPERPPSSPSTAPLAATDRAAPAQVETEDQTTTTSPLAGPVPPTRDVPSAGEATPVDGVQHFVQSREESRTDTSTRTPATWQLSLAAGARSGAFDRDVLQPMLTMALGRRWTSPQAIRWHAAIEGQAGLPLNVALADFQGQHQFAGLALGAGAAWGLTPWLSWGLGLSTGLQVTRLTGTGPESGDVSILRLVPTLQGSARLVMRAARHEFFLGPGLGLTPRRQRYTVAQLPLLTTQPSWVLAELGWNLDF